MTKINLPYNLQDGQKSSAPKLMANFGAILEWANAGAGSLDIDVAGLDANNVAGALTELLQLCEDVNKRLSEYMHSSDIGGGDSGVIFRLEALRVRKIDSVDMLYELINTIPYDPNRTYSAVIDALRETVTNFDDGDLILTIQ